MVAGGGSDAVRALDAATLAAALTPDIRIWAPDYGDNYQVVGVMSARFERHGDFNVDSAELEVIADERMDGIMSGATTHPIPVTMRLNGQWWTGAVSQATRIQEGEKLSWRLQLQSDERHLYRMQGAPNGYQDKTVQTWYWDDMRDMLIKAARRTGLPMWIPATLDPTFNGATVIATHSGLDTVGASCQYMLEQQPTFFPDVRMRLDTEFPDGVARLDWVAGPAETEWAQDRVSRGWWADRPGSSQDKRHPEEGAGPSPYGLDAAEHIVYRTQTGDEYYAEPVTAFGITPFGTRPDGSPLPDDDLTWVRRLWGDPSSLPGIVQRGMRALDSYVVYWAPGMWTDDDKKAFIESQALWASYTGPGAETMDEALKRNGAVAPDSDLFAWYKPAENGHGGRWYLGARGELQNAIDHAPIGRRDSSASSGSPWPIVPGLMVHMRAARHNETVGLSIGSGLSRIERIIKTPDCAALFVAATLSDEAIKQLKNDPRLALTPGRYSYGPADAESIHVAASDANSDLARLSSKTSIETAGPFFLRERAESISGDLGAGAAQRLRALWAEKQGSEALSVTAGAPTSVIFGQDIHLSSGVMPGWRIGDWIRIDDRPTLVTGWRVEIAAGRPISMTPLTGGRAATASPVDEFVGLVRSIQRRITTGV